METERVRRIWDKAATRYDADIAFFERVLFAGGREWICSQADVNVLEIAIGTGRNLPFYPPGVQLTGVDFSPAMLKIARRRATDLGIHVDLLVGDAQALDFKDASFDTVVITLALCSIPDERKAVAEAWRVLRPGGPNTAAGARPQPIASSSRRPATSELLHRSIPRRSYGQRAP